MKAGGFVVVQTLATCKVQPAGEVGETVAEIGQPGYRAVRFGEALGREVTGQVNSMYRRDPHRGTSSRDIRLISSVIVTF